MSNQPATGTGAGGAAASRDAGAIQPTDYTRRSLPYVGTGKRLPRFQAVVPQSVLNAIHQHGRSSPEVEVCGVLVGNIFHDGKAPYAYVEAAIAGNAAAGKATEVTFTADTWAQIQQEMDRKHAYSRVIGWYHTHPGFGIFLSPMDLFIHENFFGEPWQLAYVYDPKGGEDGLFAWRHGRPEREPYLVEPDRRSTDPPGARPAEGQAVTGSARRAEPDPAAVALAAERRKKWLLIGAAVVGLLALVVPLVILVLLSREPEGLPTEAAPGTDVRPLPAHGSR